jgi:tetratricopeptide (TPR) repeat protein
MKKIYLALHFLVWAYVPLFAQEAQLADQYFQNGEYEKAESIYEKIFKKNESNDYYFNKYMETLIALEKYEEANKVIAGQLKKQPDNVLMYVAYGNLLEKQRKDEEAEAQYKEAIERLSKDPRSVGRLANEFQSKAKYDLAIAAYEKGAKVMGEKDLFAYNLAVLYGLQGNKSKMIDNYLVALQKTPNLLPALKTQFERNFSDDDFKELQVQLYEKIQENDGEAIYPELLAWVFITKKDYENALRQVKALDKKLDETGGRVFNLANIAARDKNYDVAIEAYDYIVNEKGAMSSYYIEAKQASMATRRNKLIQGFQYTEADLRLLEKEYETFLDEFGRTKTTASIIAELAELEAFYLNDLDKAIGLLSEMIEYPGVPAQLQANAKLSLADFYLMKGEIWEATLLYSQVDKAFKDDVLGQEARFRNAKLSYYAGDFEWAQAQFDVLKASTSKLIANDALDLSIFIMDNLGLDSIETPLVLFSEADLLTFQNRFDEAFAKLDSVTMQFPNHPLLDDVLYSKAKIYLKKRDFKKAAEALQAILDKFPESIRVDNALFELASMYENPYQLNDKEKAIALYEKILMEHSGSTFAVDARKRYRSLLGEDVQ